MYPHNIRNILVTYRKSKNREKVLVQIYLSNSIAFRSISKTRLNLSI